MQKKKTLETCKSKSTGKQN